MKSLASKFKAVFIVLPLLLIVSCTRNENIITETAQTHNGSSGSLKIEEQVYKFEQNEKNSIVKEKGEQLKSSYTWEEFVALSPKEQMKFQNSFSSFDEFDKWLQKAQEEIDDFSWESKNGQPSSYTWEEFEALSPEEQMKFQNSFSSFDELRMGNHQTTHGRSLKN